MLIRPYCAVCNAAARQKNVKSNQRQHDKRWCSPNQKVGYRPTPLNCFYRLSHSNSMLESRIHVLSLELVEKNVGTICKTSFPDIQSNEIIDLLCLGFQGFCRPFLDYMRPMGLDKYDGALYPLLVLIWPSTPRTWI